VSEKITIKYSKLEDVLCHLPAMETDPDRFVDSDGYGQLYKALYDAGLILDFDWMEWTGRAQEYVNRPELIKDADLDAVCKLLTTHVRNDRFCDNHLSAMIRNGHIAAVLRRLAELVPAGASAAKPGLRACIHRGAHQIGGTCIELECQGQYLVLDVGLPLDSPNPDSVPLPPLKSLTCTRDSSPSPPIGQCRENPMARRSGPTDSSDIPLADDESHPCPSVLQSFKTVYS